MTHLLIENLLNPPVLFFVLGVIAILAKSDLELPPPMPKALSLYLLFCIGLHGGVSLSKSGVTPQVGMAMVAAVVMSTAMAVVAFLILRLKLDRHNSAAIAATYGSVSAVTFMTAGNFLMETKVAYNGHMVAALALMESPAIVAALLCLRMSEKGRRRSSLGGLFVESLLNGSVFLLLGSVVIGFLSGESGWDKVSPFAQGIFGGALCLFLLDMGLSAGRGLGSVGKAGLFPVIFALAFPLFGAALGVAVSRLLGFPHGDALLFTVLCASASYIAVPAVMKSTVPEANPGLYVPMALGLTFPLNILLGIPLYDTVIRHLLK